MPSPMRALSIPRWLMDPVALWYSVLSTCGTLSAVLFNNLHMVVFSERLSAGSVARVHSVYFVWNTLNDLAGGYVSDSYGFAYGSRLPLIRWLSMGVCAASVLPFVEVGLPPAWHYFLSIFLFDGFMSVLAICRGSLFTELAHEEGHRINMQRINSLFGSVEFVVKTLGYFAINLEGGRGPIRGLVLSVGAFSVCCTLLSVHKLQRYRPSPAPTTAPPPSVRSGLSALAAAMALLRAGCRACCAACSYARHVLGGVRRHTNLWAFVAANALLEAENLFRQQYNVVIVGVLLVHWSGPARASLLTAVGAVGGTGALLLSWVGERYGVPGVYRVAFLTKTAVAVVVVLLLLTPPRSVHNIVAAARLSAARLAAPGTADGGTSLDLPFVVFLVLSQICTSGPAFFFPVMIGRLENEYRDLLANDKSDGTTDGGTDGGTDRPPAGAGAHKFDPAMVGVGTFMAINAGVSKPLNSLGPVVAAWVLDSGGYLQWQQQQTEDGTGGGGDGDDADGGVDLQVLQLHAACLFFGMPLVLGIGQCLAFGVYRTPAPPAPGPGELA